MTGVNKAIVLGHLGGDPEIRRTAGGNPVATFSVATSERWRDKGTGEQRERTDWHRVVVFSEGLCEIAEKYLKKGSKVYIEGAMKTRKWTGSDNVERYTTEVVLQGFQAKIVLLDRAERPPAADEGSYGSEPAAPPPSRAADLDDEIPF